MKKLLTTLLITLGLLAPLSALATTATPWSITNLTDTFIFPNAINGTKKGIIVTASSTINGALTVTNVGSGFVGSNNGLLYGFSSSSITTLSALSLPYSQLTGVPAFDTFAYPFPAGATSTVVNFQNGIVDGTFSGLIAGNSGNQYAVSTTSMNASITGSSGSVANALTFNNSGSGASSGQTFNGSSAQTISYNTIGAQVAGIYDAVVTATTPILRNVNNLIFVGLATTTQPASSNLLTSNGAAGVYGTATSTLTPSAPLGGSFTQIGTGGTITCASCNTSNATVSSVATTYPILGGTFTTTGTISTAFGTTTNWGVGTTGFYYPNSAGVLTTAASSSFFGYTPLNPTRNVNTTFPLQGGGALTGDLTLTNAFSTTSNSGMAAGNLYVGSGGIFQTSASSTIFGTLGTPGQVLMSSNGVVVWAATSSVAASGVFPFAADTNFGAVVYSTSTPTLWFKSGVFASSTSRIDTLFLGSTTPQAYTNAPLVITGNTTGNVQAVLGNTTAGTAASADYIVGSDLMTNVKYYGDIGYNSSLNTEAAYTAFGGNALYMYNNDGELDLATASTTNVNAAIKFITGGTLVANERARFTQSGYLLVGTTTPLLQSLTIGSSTAAQLSLSDNTNPTSWFFRTINGNLFAGTTTSSGATTTLSAFSISANGQLYTLESRISTTSVMTIDWLSTPNQVDVQIGAGTITIGFNNASTTGMTKRVFVCNPLSAAGAITWAFNGNVIWSGGTTPTQITTANKCDLYSFVISQATSTNPTNTPRIFGAQTTF